MITIESTYNGPAGWGHGGTAAGYFAANVEPDGATVRFHNPVPLGAAMTMERTEKGVTFHHDGEAIATARDLERPLSVGRFPSVDQWAVGAAQRRWLDARDGLHMAPTCYACGHQRRSGGLQLRPGPVGVDGVHATNWEPEGDGRLPSWLLWAAMDCPTGFPAFHHVDADEGVVTGELSVQVLRPVMAGERYTILSRRVGGEGRRHDTEAMLLGPDGSSLALATATWITVPLAAVLPELAKAS
jgi:hypothetical protein